MSKDVNTSEPEGCSPSPRPRSPQAMLAVINGVLVGVSALYLATGSIIVTVIGVVAALALVALYLTTHR